jgi:glycerol-1-phosphate dehydrogenase [NAD(P)+]
MVRAGLGDLVSKPVSIADWRLASLVADEHYCPLPWRMMEEAFALCRREAEDIGLRKPEAIKVLLEALVLSGFSMAVAGSSSPASGGEHLISHYWDMTAPREGRRRNLHGAQVGVATMITATLYQRLRALDPAEFNVPALVDATVTIEEREAEVRRRHGELAGVVWPEARKKYISPEQRRSRLERVVADWDVIWTELDRFLEPPEVIREILSRAGAITEASELGVSSNEVFRALTEARDIRARYTVLDFAAELGLLDEWAEDVIFESGVRG